MGTLKLEKNTMIKWLITFILPLITYFALPIEGDFYTPQLRSFSVITILCLLLIAFELLNILVIAALLPILYGLFKVSSFETIFSPWLSTTIYMILGSFVLTAILQECGLLNRLAYWLMSKIGNNYYGLIVGIFLFGTILSILTFGNGYIIMGALCVGLCASLNFLNTKMAVVIGFSCIIGSVTSKSYIYTATAYGILKNMSNGLLDDTVLNQLSIIKVLVDNLPMFFICLFMVLIAAKWYKPDMEKVESKDYFHAKLQSLGPISREEKINGILLACVVLWMMTTNLHHQSIDYAFMIFPYLAFTPFLNSASESCFRNVNFSMIFFVVACMSIGTVATSLNFSTAIAGMMQSLLGGSTNVFIIFLVLFLIVFILNFLLTPLAIWAIITVPVLELAINLGLEPLPFVYGLLQTAEAIIFPYEYVPYLVVFSFGMIGMKDFIKLNIMRCAIYILGFMILLIPWWKLIGVL